MMSVSEAPGQTLEIQFPAAALSTAVPVSTAKGPIKEIRFGDRRLTKDLQSSRADDGGSQPAMRRTRRALNLAVVGLTSPIFAKAGSISCRAVHENGNRLPIDIGLQKAERNGFKGKRSALQNREW